MTRKRSRFHLRLLSWKHQLGIVCIAILYLVNRESFSTLLFGAIWFGCLAFALPWIVWALFWLVPIAQWMLGIWAGLHLTIAVLKFFQTKNPQQ